MESFRVNVKHRIGIKRCFHSVMVDLIWYEHDKLITIIPEPMRLCPLPKGVIRFSPLSGMKLSQLWALFEY